MFRNFTATQAIFFFGQNYDTAALRRFVGETGQLCGVR